MGEASYVFGIHILRKRVYNVKFRPIKVHAYNAKMVWDAEV